MDADSNAANVLEVLVPLIALALLVTGAVISGLKGHWWMGIVGAVGFGVGVMWLVFGSLDVRPLVEVEETVANRISLASAIATLAGIVLLLAGAVRPARPGSWWDRRRTPTTAAG